MAEPDYRAMARAIAEAAGIDPSIFERQIMQESGFNPNARSSMGAAGIAQLMPVHWSNVDPYDPEAALNYGANLMSSALGRYNGDYASALASYNAGPGNLQQFGNDPWALAAHPKFDETRRYLESILGGSGMANGYGGGAGGAG